MRIAIFSEIFLPKVDGVVTRLRNTISELHRAGDEVLIFCPDGGIDTFEGARVIGMPAGGHFPLYPELRLALPRRSMGKALVDFQPDVIHAVEPALLGVAGIYYAAILRVSLVISYHTDLPRYLHYYGLGAIEGLVWQAMRLRHNQAAINLCTSSPIVKKLDSHGIERVALWQRGIDTELFHPSRVSRGQIAKIRGYPLFLLGRAERNDKKIRPGDDDLLPHPFVAVRISFKSNRGTVDAG